MSELIPYAIGAVIYFALQRFGIVKPSAPTSPVSPTTPSPVIPATPVASPILSIATELFSWLLKAKAQDVKLDDHSKEILKSMQPILDELFPKVSTPSSAPPGGK